MKNGVLQTRYQTRRQQSSCKPEAGHAPAADWQKKAHPRSLVIIRTLTGPSIPYSRHGSQNFSPTSERTRLRSIKNICELTLGLPSPSVFQVEFREAERIRFVTQVAELGKPALFQPQKPAEIRLSPARRPNPIALRSRPHTLKIKVRACAAINVNGQYKMQDHNHWYSLQRSNTGQHAYSLHDSASNTPTLPPAGLHDNQALSSVYSLASAVRPTQGESFSASLDTNHLPYTAVSRHLSHLSMAAHSPSHAQPQYFNTNGCHSPSPNPPPYTEYATELNCPQSLRNQEVGSSYWTTIGGNTSRYTEEQPNR
jgi:hypothetical protein